MISMREIAKRALDFTPKPIYRVARFASRLPVYFATDLAYQRSTEKRLGHGNLAITDDISIFLPSDRVASSVFRSMLFESSERHEWQEFLELARPCRAFVDVGASGGFFSMLFAASRPSHLHGAAVLSIEPDQSCRRTLEELRALHGRPGLNWNIDACAVGAEPGTTSFASSGFGGEIVSANRDNRGELEELASINGLSSKVTTVEVSTLDRICERNGIVPDLVKMDIESYEHEVLHASIGFLRKTSPRLHLELHCGYLRDRAIDPTETLTLLRHAGYRPFHRDAPTWDSLFDRARSEFVLRVDLVPVTAG